MNLQSIIYRASTLDTSVGGYAQIVNELIKTKMRQPIAFCFNCGKKLKEAIKNEK